MAIFQVFASFLTLYIVNIIWKLFIWIDLNEIYQMAPNLSQSDLAFRFYAPKTTKKLTFRLGQHWSPEGLKPLITQKSKVFRVLETILLCFLANIYPRNKISSKTSKYFGHNGEKLGCSVRAQRSLPDQNAISQRNKLYTNLKYSGGLLIDIVINFLSLQLF